MTDPDSRRLTRRLELLEAALADSNEPEQRRALRDELLEVHRHFDRIGLNDIESQRPRTTRRTMPEGSSARSTGEAPGIVDDHPHEPPSAETLDSVADPKSETLLSAGSSEGGADLSEDESATDEPVEAAGPPSRHGYYPDPFDDNGFMRYFDGSLWDNGTYPPGGPSLKNLDVPKDRRKNAPPGQPRNRAAHPNKPTRPGFYSDPFSADGYERHFDGERWGDATHPLGGPTLDSLKLTEDQRTGNPSASTNKSAPATASTSADTKTNPVNKFAVAAFVHGLLSILLFEIGIVPILAVIFSLIGLGTYRTGEHSGRWMAVVGLILGVLYSFAYLAAYGHIAI